MPLKLGRDGTYGLAAALLAFASLNGVDRSVVIFDEEAPIPKQKLWKDADALERRRLQRANRKR